MVDENETRDGTIEAFDEYQKRLIEYEKVYATRVPPPEKPSDKELSFWSLVGIKSTLFSVSAMGAVIFSAIRTGGYFYIVERLLLTNYGIEDTLSNSLSIAAFISALLAFEGFALADGFSKGEKMSEVEESVLGIWASFLTIVVVGIFSGLEIVELSEVLEMWLNVIVALVTSISAAGIAFFGGNNLGFAFAEYKRKKIEILDTHQEAYNGWKASAYSSFTSTLGSLKSHVQDSVQSSVQSEHKSEHLHSNVQDGEFNKVSEMNKSETTYTDLNTFVQNNKKIPSVRALVKLVAEKSNLKISVGTASNVINDYVCNNGELLIEDGIIDDERFKDACSKMSSVDGDIGE